MSYAEDLGHGPTITAHVESNFSNHYYYYYDLDDIYVLTGDIDKYSIPAIFSFGIPANLVAAMVFFTKTFRQASFGVNLVGKSLSDTVFLVCTLIVWLEHVNIHLLHNPGVCQMVVYLTYISAFTSVWFVVALALENLIRIRYPFRVGTLCQARKACIMVIIMLILACCLYFPTLWFNRVDDIQGLNLCQRSLDMTLISLVYTYVDSLVTLIIPCGLIVVFLVMTIDTVWSSKARSLRMFRDLRVSFSVIMQQQVTRMLSAVSITFIILTFPSHMTRLVLLVMVWNYDTADITPRQYLTQHIFQLLYYLSFAINLLTYIVFCPKVRYTLRQYAKRFCSFPSSEKGLELMSNSVILTDHISSGSSDNFRGKPVRMMLEVRIKSLSSSANSTHEVGVTSREGTSE
ncbi:probable G-protein coupled receptor 174 [Liolophura sinensis]|uniref:probable G-protein coupled receptor 174 n=1 Tax=Liolophura sinensis TaxID=3198878 RepID=UPI00315885D0